MPIMRTSWESVHGERLRPDGARRPAPKRGPIACGESQSSSSTVNGPSFTLVTAIVAAKTPVATTSAAAAQFGDHLVRPAARRPSRARRPTSDGRRPLRRAAVQRELAHYQDRARRVPAADCSSRRMRSSCSLPASAVAVAAVSVWVTPISASRPGESIAPTTTSSTVTEARQHPGDHRPHRSLSRGIAGRVQQPAGDGHPDRRQHRGGQRLRVEPVGRRRAGRPARPAAAAPVQPASSARPQSSTCRWHPARRVGAACAAPAVQPSCPASERSSRITDDDRASRDASSVGVGRRRLPAAPGQEGVRLRPGDLLAGRGDLVQDHVRVGTVGASQGDHAHADAGDALRCEPVQPGRCRARRPARRGSPASASQSETYSAGSAISRCTTQASQPVALHPGPDPLPPVGARRSPSSWPAAVRCRPGFRWSATPADQSFADRRRRRTRSRGTRSAARRRR